jgi:hypothetical protein
VGFAAGLAGSGWAGFASDFPAVGCGGAVGCWAGAAGRGRAGSVGAGAVLAADFGACGGAGASEGFAGGLGWGVGSGGATGRISGRGGCGASARGASRGRLVLVFVWVGPADGWFGAAAGFAGAGLAGAGGGWAARAISARTDAMSVCWSPSASRSASFGGVASNVFTAKSQASTNSTSVICSIAALVTPNVSRNTSDQ